MNLPLVAEEDIVVPEGHPDPASYRRDMASLGMVMIGNSFFTGSIQNIADTIVDIVQADKTHDKTKREERKSNGGFAPRLEVSQHVLLDSTAPKKRTYPFDQPDLTAGKAEVASLSAEEVCHIELEFNEDFTDVTMLSLKHTSAMKAMSESLMAKHKAEHEFDQAFEIVCETSKAMAKIEDKADTTI